MPQFSNISPQATGSKLMDSCFPSGFEDTEPSSVLDLNIHATPGLGRYWPGEGGVYIGQIKQPNDARCYYMVAAVGFSKDSTCWHHTPIDVKGACDYSNGWANTSSMAMLGCQIALLARSVTIDGKNDWYIPSQAEAHLLAANGRNHLSDISFWTSTQHSHSIAWCQDINSGSQFTSNKGSSFSIVLVRKFAY